VPKRRITETPKIIDQNTQAMTSCQISNRRVFEACSIRVVAGYAASGTRVTAAEAVGVVEEIVDFDGGWHHGNGQFSLSSVFTFHDLTDT
jgi:hypothetical protein